MSSITTARTSSRSGACSGSWPRSSPTRSDDGRSTPATSPGLARAYDRSGRTARSPGLLRRGPRRLGRGRPGAEPPGMVGDRRRRRPAPVATPPPRRCGGGLARRGRARWRQRGLGLDRGGQDPRAQARATCTARSRPPSGRWPSSSAGAPSVCRCAPPSATSVAGCAGSGGGRPRGPPRQPTGERRCPRPEQLAHGLTANRRVACFELVRRLADRSLANLDDLLGAPPEEVMGWRHSSSGWARRGPLARPDGPHRTSLASLTAARHLPTRLSWSGCRCAEAIRRWPQRNRPAIGSGRRIATATVTEHQRSERRRNPGGGEHDEDQVTGAARRHRDPGRRQGGTPGHDRRHAGGGRCHAGRHDRRNHQTDDRRPPGRREPWLEGDRAGLWDPDGHDRRDRREPLRRPLREARPRRSRRTTRRSTWS